MLSQLCASHYIILTRNALAAASGVVSRAPVNEAMPSAFAMASLPDEIKAMCASPSQLFRRTYDVQRVRELSEWTALMQDEGNGSGVCHAHRLPGARSGDSD